MRVPLRTTLRTIVLSAGLAVGGCGDSQAVVPAEPGTSTTTGAGPSTSSGDETAPTGTSGGTSSGETSDETSDTSDAATGGTTGDAPTTGGPDETDGVAETGGEDESGGSSTTGGDVGTTGSSSTSDGDEPPVPDPPVPDPPTPGPEIKVMTFNIRVGTANDGENAWDKRKKLVYQVFKDQDADFVGVQEAQRFQLLEIDAAVPAYDRIGAGTVDGATKGSYNAIYYRKSRFTKKQSGNFWLSKTPEVAGSHTWGNELPRAVTWGRFVEDKSSYTFYVYNTHFDHISQNSREKGAVLLGKRIAERPHPGDPFVVTGDFNAAEGNVAVRFLKGDAKIDGALIEIPLRDSFRVAKPDAQNVGTAHGFNGGTGGNKIDYVFVPAKQKVLGAQIVHFNVDGKYPSDHFPVTGTIKLADKP